MNHERPRLATLEDLSEEQVVTSSYEKYLSRMDTPAAPMQRDDAEAIENRKIWVVGNPVQGLVSLITQPEAVLLIENVAVHPSIQGGRGRELMQFAAVVVSDSGRPARSLHQRGDGESLTIYEHPGFSEVVRRTEDGYRRVHIEKTLPGS
jgi:hypothetical protein